jgi:hypothetical protein
VEVDAEEMRELKTGAGGVLMLTLPQKSVIGVRLHESPGRK